MYEMHRGRGCVGPLALPLQQGAKILLIVVDETVDKGCLEAVWRGIVFLVILIWLFKDQSGVVLEESKMQSLRTRPPTAICEKATLYFCRLLVGHEAEVVPRYWVRAASFLQWPILVESAGEGEHRRISIINAP